MLNKLLDRLMFAQGELCFFCGKRLSKAEASVEHLLPSSRGGSNGDENCVACCTTVNALLGCMSLKEKIRVVLNQKGKFTCPKSGGAASAQPAPTASKQKLVASPPKNDSYTILLAGLKKLGATRPRRVKTLKNTIRAILNNSSSSLTDAQVEKLFERLQENGKIAVEETKVSYSL